MTANPFAALLAGVTRFNVKAGDHTDPSVLMLETEVLAALAAAVPADLAEAAGRLELAWIALHGQKVANPVHSILARIAAQEVQIKGLEEAIDANWITHQRVVAAETALAAERAKVARLVEAGKRLLEPLDEPCRHDHHGYCQSHFLEADCSVVALRAAITEAEQ